MVVGRERWGDRGRGGERGGGGGERDRERGIQSDPSILHKNLRSDSLSQNMIKFLFL